MTGKTKPPVRNNRTPLMILISVLLVIIAVVLFFVFSQLMNNPEEATIASGAAIVNSDSYFDGSNVIDPPRELKDFTLTSQEGTPISLSDLRGKVVLIYFGYTNCPDICPITLGDFKQIKQDLGDKADQMAFVMVSVDGERDTPERMKSFLSNFDPEFIGMTGDEATLRAIVPDYNVVFEKQNGENYAVDHTASLFMVDPEGRLTTIFDFATEPDVIVEGIIGQLS